MNSTPILAALASTEYQCIEPLLCQIDQTLTLRTFIAGSYTLNPLDEQIWTILQSNRVALGLIRRNALPNLTRWFTYIEADQPRLRDSAIAAKATNPDTNRYNVKLQHIEKGVVTRFPPEPSGYLHIGHAKAAFLNEYFARNNNGSLILRFDDTNPTRESLEFHDSIVHDLVLLGIHADRVTYTSDYFEQLYDLCSKLIAKGNAYAEDTDVETQKTDRRNRRPSARRDRSASESLAIFRQMREGTDVGRRHCIRARIAFNHSNGSLRDPIIYRFPSWDGHDPQPHHRTGWTWAIYPTYDFACPLVDSIEGVTHALRTTEYADRNDQYDWFQTTLGLRKVYLWDFARINFIRTFLSKRKLAQVVSSGSVHGWNDPRMPTIRGILRRGLTVEALREFMLKQGPSRNVVAMDWTVLWATNKKVIDSTAPRHTVVEAKDAVLVTVNGGPEAPTQKSRQRHPKNPSLGTKQVTFAKKIYIEQADAVSFQIGEEITLMSWGNAIVQEVTKSDSPVTGLQLQLYLDGDASKTDKKVHWVAVGDKMHSARLWEFDHLLTKDSLGKTDILDNFLNPVTATSKDAKVGQDFGGLAEGDIVQVERKGYFRVDQSVGQGPDGKAVLFKIPTGASDRTVS